MVCERGVLLLAVLGVGAVVGCVPTLTDPDGDLVLVALTPDAGPASLNLAPDTNVPGTDGERSAAPSLTAEGSPPATLPLASDDASTIGAAPSVPGCDPVRPQTPRPDYVACAAGQGCRPAEEEGGAARCVPGGASAVFQPCELSADCLPGLVCLGVGLCNALCLDDSDCATGACRPFSEPLYAGAQQAGVCTQRCDLVHPSSGAAPFIACPDGLACSAQSDGDTWCRRAGSGRHWASCTEDVQCAPGFFCELLTGRCTQYCREDADCDSRRCSRAFGPPLLDIEQRELRGCQAPSEGMPCTCTQLLAVCPDELVCFRGECQAPPQAAPGGTDAGADPADGAACSGAVAAAAACGACGACGPHQICRDGVCEYDTGRELTPGASGASDPAASGTPCAPGAASCECSEPAASCLDESTLQLCQGGQVHVSSCEGRCVPSVSGARCATCGVVAVSADAFPCALFGTGEVYCWPFVDVAGRPVAGNEILPPVSGLVPVRGFGVGLATGAKHACALLASGEVRCWGDNAVGQLGRGISPSLLPASADPGAVDLGGPAVDVVASSLTSCALRQDGAVLCWGAGAFGVLGNGQYEAVVSVGDEETPASVGPVQLGGRAVQIALGFGHACAVMEDGAVRCWGRNEFGELGYGHTEDIGDDEAVVDAGTVELPGRALQVVTGYANSCALLEGGSVRCWGDNSLGQLGYGDGWTCNGATPDAGAGDGSVALRAPASQLLALSAYNCALLRDGSVTCWGIEGSSERVGCEELVAPRAEGTLGAARLMAGVFGPCVQLRNGEVACWDVSTFGNALPEELGASVRPSRRGLLGPGALPVRSAPGCQICD